MHRKIIINNSDYIRENSLGESASNNTVLLVFNRKHHMHYFDCYQRATAIKTGNRSSKIAELNKQDYNTNFEVQCV